MRALLQIYGRFRRAGYTFALVHIEEQRCPSGRVVSGLDREERRMKIDTMSFCLGVITGVTIMNVVFHIYILNE